MKEKKYRCDICKVIYRDRELHDWAVTKHLIHYEKNPNYDPFGDREKDIANLKQCIVNMGKTTAKRLRAEVEEYWRQMHEKSEERGSVNIVIG